MASPKKHSRWDKIKTGAARLRLSYNSIYFKLIVYLLCIIVPLLGILVGSNWYAIQVVRNQVSQTYQHQAAFYTQNTDRGLSEADRYLSSLQSVNTDLELMIYAQNNDDYHLAQMRLYHKMLRDISLYPAIDAFFYYNAGRQSITIIDSSLTSYSHKQGITDFVKSASEHPELYNADDLSTWMIKNIKGEYYFIRLLKVTDIYLGAWVNANRLLESYALQGGDDVNIPAYVNENGSVITTNYSVPVSSINYQQIIDGYTDRSGPEKYTVVGDISSKGKYALVNVIPDDAILAQLPFFQWFFLVLSLACIALLPLYLYFLKRIFWKPFSVMLTAMKRIRNGNLDERIPRTQTSNEFQTVNDTFNEMMEQIKGLKISFYEERINRQKETLLALQLQVKPHFYLNSLNMIHTLAKKQDYTLIMELSMCLVRYFRYMFQSNTFVSLADELYHVQNYLKIQELRFPGSFRYEIQVSELLASAPVPSLLIQGFAENTIKYAVTLDETAFLSIRGELTEDNDMGRALKVIIEDDGPGFSQDILAKIETGEKIVDNNGEHLGIWNIRRRLLLLYQGKSRLSIGNAQPHGAHIEIILPFSPENEKEALP